MVPVKPLVRIPLPQTVHAAIENLISPDGDDEVDLGLAKLFVNL